MAYLSKLTQGKNGEFLSPQVISRQATLFNTIFSPADRAVIRRFLNELDRISWKDPNPSGTATSLAGLGNQLFAKFFDAFGPLGRAAFERSGLQQAWGTSIARQAVREAPSVFPSMPANSFMLRYGNALMAPTAINNALAVPHQR
ncbi:MAG: hypothetical protein JSR89_02215 [Proteobacteria bacterium]|nr:hypothetical protein [Pseudomonadota bacterium]